MAFGSFDRKTSSQPMAEINMVPLIDVVLVLLVIFIVTAPLLTNVVKLDLPKATSAADIQKPEKVEFAIDANGGLFWKGERITREDAIARFAEEGASGRSPRSTCAPTRTCPTATSPRPWPTPPRAACPRSPSSANRRAIRRPGARGPATRPVRSHPDRRSGSGGRRESRRPL